MHKIPLRTVGVVLGISAAALWLLSSRHHAYSGVAAQRQWLLRAAQELTQAAPPAPALPSTPGTNNLGRPPWQSLPNYLVFSNGWVGYRINTIHDDEAIGDIAVLRSSDGALYYSTQHYCVGITEWMEPEFTGEVNPAPPSNLRDYLAHYGRAQRWNTLASDDGLWCLLTCPYARGRSKQLFVWLSEVNGTNRSTLLDYHCKVKGSHISWATHWLSNDCVTVDIYDYSDERLGGAYPATTKSNYIKSLSFRRDKHTGRFAIE